MNYSFSAQLLFPIVLLIIQTYILLFGALFLLRKLSIAGTPYTDMEIGQVVVTAAVLFSVFYISTADYGPLFQSFKTHLSREDKYGATFYRFGQYFLDIVGAEIIFMMLTLLNLKIFLGIKNPYADIREGNVPWSVLVAVVVLSFGVLTHYITAEIINFLTPKIVIFN